MSVICSILPHFRYRSVEFYSISDRGVYDLPFPVEPGPGVSLAWQKLLEDGTEDDRNGDSEDEWKMATPKAGPGMFQSPH